MTLRISKRRLEIEYIISKLEKKSWTTKTMTSMNQKTKAE